MFNSQEPDSHFYLAEENLADVSSYPATAGDRVRTEGTLPGMKQVKDLPLWPIWVNPEHLVRTALVLMRGHGVAGLGVIEGKEFAGVLYIEDLAGVSEDTPVSQFVRTDLEAVDPNTTLRRVAELMTGQNLPRIPVVEDGQFLGIVSAHDLLRDIGRNFDPLTQLPWSDALREWGLKNFEAGHEITILFFDLDEFGPFNKRFGHMVGDQVLRRVADELRSNVAPAMDLLCRYGGDEFAIGTLRPRGEAEYLASSIGSKITGLEIEGALLPISISHGVFGGRRTKEREGTHFAATLDNLINEASRLSTAMKESRSAQEPVPSGCVSLDSATVDLVSATSEQFAGGYRGVAVLSVDGELFTGVSEPSRSPRVAVAEATAKALELATGAKLQVLNVIESEAEGAQAVTVVGLRDGEAVASSSLSLGELPTEIARITLSAFLPSR